jgi:hypothetical protein
MQYNIEKSISMLLTVPMQYTMAKTVLLFFGMETIHMNSERISQEYFRCTDVGGARCSQFYFRVASKIIVHEGFIPAKLDSSHHDLALIKFDRPLFMTALEKNGVRLNPICLPTPRLMEENRPGEEREGGIDPQASRLALV